MTVNEATYVAGVGLPGWRFEMQKTGVGNIFAGGAVLGAAAVAGAVFARSTGDRMLEP